MPNTTVQLSADTATKILTVIFLEHESVEISYDTEADFTDLVEVLLLLIDQDLRIDLSIEGIEEHDDQKLNFVVATVEEIIESFNDSFEIHEEIVDEQPSTEDDDLPF